MFFYLSIFVRIKNMENENKLGSWPIPKLLINMSLPMMLSFFIQALYNMVDSMFVARISEDALTAVSLAFPMQQVANAIAVGVGVGMSALIPRFMGQNEPHKANQTAHVGIFLNLCATLLFMGFALLFSHSIYTIQTTNTSIIAYGTSYLRIVWGAGIGVFFCQYFEKMLVCSGNSFYAMIAQASGAIFNIIFDPLLIFGLGPFPRMGIAGAAIATVLGQIFASIVGLFFNISKNDWIHFSLKEICFRKDIVKDIFAVGIPSMVTIGLASATSFCVNLIIIAYSTTATAVYGIWLKLQNFCFMPIFGMNNGMIPILSYNQARKQRERVVSCANLAFLYVFILMFVLTLILELFPAPFLQLFSASEHMLEIGIPAIRICVLSLVFAGISLIVSSATQALDYARYTLYLNILRQFVVIVSAFYLLSTIFHSVSYLWWALPITEIICCVVSVVLFRKMLKQI